ncbi:MAG: methyltransferase [Acidimicrobiia bacterium]
MPGQRTARVPPAWLIRPLLAVRNGIAGVHRGMVPPEVVLLETTLGVIDTKTLGVVAELGVADQLAVGPMTGDALGAACSADADALTRVLRYLVSRGFFRTTRDGRFRNNKRSELLRDLDGSARAWARFIGADWHVDIWNHLEHSVRTGGAATEVALGRPFWEYLTEVNPAAGAVFDEAMESASAVQMGVVARKYDWSACTRVCDVGGGTGTLLSAILAPQEYLRGVLFDLPTVVAKSGPVLEAAGVADRVEVIGGDFFAAVPEGCDRYVLQAIVHDWDDESCVRFLSNCRDAMAPGGRVLVLEFTMPEHDGAHFAKSTDLEMLVDTGAGRERTRAEFDALFARAGLRVRKVIPIVLTAMFELEAA